MKLITLRAARRRGGTRGSDSDAEFNGYRNGYVLRDVRQFRPQPQQRANAQVTVQQQSLEDEDIHLTSANVSPINN